MPQLAVPVNRVQGWAIFTKCQLLKIIFYYYVINYVHVYMYVVVFFGLKNQFILSFCLTQIVLIVVRQSQKF